VLCLISIALAVLTARVRAQEVRGTVLDAVSGIPVAAADITLLQGDSTVATSITDSAGYFVTRAHDSGRFQIRVSRMGYAALITKPFAVGLQESAVLQLRLRPEPSSLDPVEVAVERRVTRLERVGFYQRSTRGFGYFLKPDDIQQLRPLFPEDLFYGMAGIRAVRSSDSVTLVRWPFSKPCPLTVAVDGFIVSGWTELVHVNDVLALEVYPRPAGLPPWLAGTASPCGAVVVWTK
jgi:hypothetical protein